MDVTHSGVGMAIDRLGFFKFPRESPCSLCFRAIGGRTSSATRVSAHCMGRQSGAYILHHEHIGNGLPVSAHLRSTRPDWPPTGWTRLAMVARGNRSRNRRQRPFLSFVFEVPPTVHILQIEPAGPMVVTTAIQTQARATIGSTFSRNK